MLVPTGSNDAKLIVKRESKFIGFAAKLQILLDNDQIGVVGNGEEIIKQLSPGNYVVTAKGMYGRSNSLSIDAVPGGEIVIEAEVGSPPKLQLIHATVSTQAYTPTKMELEQRIHSLEAEKRRTEQESQAANVSRLGYAASGALLAALFGVGGMVMIGGSLLYCLVIPGILGCLIGIAMAESSRQKSQADMSRSLISIDHRMTQVRRELDKIQNQGDAVSVSSSSIQSGETQLSEHGNSNTSAQSSPSVQMKSEQLEAELRKVKRLLEEGLISEDEYQEVRQRLIKSL